MEVNTTGAYSPDIVYGQLTYPFTPKNISINAHTPYDKESEDSKSIANFKDYIGKNVNFRYEANEQDEYSFGIDTNNYNPPSVETVKELPEFPPKGINWFSASNTSNKDIVTSALNKGYSYEQALVVANAQKAYKTSAGITKDPIDALSTRIYQVR